MLHSLHMTPINATITSKNQVTLPIALVRKYKLDVNRQITFTDKNGVIEITPQPSLEERIQAIHERLPSVTGTQSDEALQQAIREAYAEKDI